MSVFDTQHERDNLDEISSRECYIKRNSISFYVFLNTSRPTLTIGGEINNTLLIRTNRPRTSGRSPSPFGDNICGCSVSGQIPLWLN